MNNQTREKKQRDLEQVQGFKKGDFKEWSNEKVEEEYYREFQSENN